MFEWEKQQQDVLEGEMKKTVEIAKAMYADGVSIDKISKYTGLTEAEIKKPAIHRLTIQQNISPTSQRQAATKRSIRAMPRPTARRTIPKGYNITNRP